MIREPSSGAEKSSEFGMDQAVYGGYKNFMPRHYVFEGFKNNQEFETHLNTLLDWQVSEKSGLSQLGVDPSSQVQDLEHAMASLINASNQVTETQTSMQASIDTLRQ